MTSLIRRFAAVSPAPWSNGLGRTWELIDEQRAAALTPGHPWRLSVASLDTPAPFSAFPGLHRTQIPWGGDISLEIDDTLHRVAHGEVVRYAGGSRTSLVDIDRPCHAINLMAPSPVPTLTRADSGARFDDPVVALVTEQSSIAERFDVLAVSAGDALPSPAIVVTLRPGPAPRGTNRG